MFRFTLTHEILGSLQIDEPAGWKDIVFRLNRNIDQGFHSLWETFEGSFTFYGDNGHVNGGIDRIREVINEYGPDATLQFLGEYTSDGYSYRTVIDALLALDTIQENPDNTATIAIIPNDLRTKLKNRYETPVNIQSEKDIYNNDAEVFPASDLELLSQIIRKTNTYNGAVGFSDDVFYQIKSDGDLIDAEGASDGPYDGYSQAQVDLDQEEITESFDTLLDIVADPLDLANMATFTEESGELLISLEEPLVVEATYLFSLGFSGGDAGSDPSIVESIAVQGFIQVYVNDVIVAVLASDGDVNSTPIPTPVISGTAGFREFQLTFPATSATINVNKGDSVKVLMKWSVILSIDVGSDSDVFWGSFWPLADGPYLQIDNYEPKFRVQFKSEYKTTNSEAFLVHDVAGMVIDRITGEPGSFYSEILGSDRTVYRQYDDIGCHWDKILVKGLQLRRYLLADKPFFISLRDWWEGINPILNLGLGYETIDGREVFRVEGKEYFYNQTISVNISNVYEITRAYDVSVMVKTWRGGYKTWQSENFSGIDDAQTRHTMASRFEKTGSEITMESGFIAASLAIETTRRTAKEKSADYKFDDNTFIIVISEYEGSPDGAFTPETDEKYEYINNLNDPHTRYNHDLTPARNFLRWAPWIFGGLQHYVGSLLKFVSGEGNYAMESERSVSDGCDEYNGPLAENQDIAVTDEYYHRPEIYRIKTPLEFEDYLEIAANRNNAIGISQTTANHRPFFIKELSYEPVDGVVTIMAWPIEYFEIQVIDQDPVNQVCEADEEECEDAYLTEIGDELITESGNCLVLD